MQDNLFLLIESHRMDFTAVEQVIADYLVSKKPILRIEELAKAIAVSPSSITRFCKKLNLNNYKELIFLYNLSLEDSEESVPVSSSVTASYHALATQSDTNFAENVIEHFCKAIYSKKTINFWGMGFNSFAGGDFQFKFSRLGKFVRVASDQHTILMTAHFADQSDLIIISTLRGEDETLYEAAKIAQQKGVEILLITANKEAKIIQFATETLFAASLLAEDTLGNISPQIPILIELDMIYRQYQNMYQSTIRQWVMSEQILTDKFKGGFSD
ncbi:MurR/RpiR family transcriptional regulator [Listeria aquatica]|uniref:Transcriptional regulator n=1 Tax=Listeria aquatica FSL S10-1188 TaxID=1265818 RepID=W7BPB5_9LIST|nr:MurR/RpiR family transcriptional regulator [Listeria aquatica]EUJ21898.1 transcriptional regulator [Listeria aquatica FSL S10-1188]